MRQGRLMQKALEVMGVDPDVPAKVEKRLIGCYVDKALYREVVAVAAVEQITQAKMLRLAVRKFISDWHRGNTKEQAEKFDQVMAAIGEKEGEA